MEKEKIVFPLALTTGIHYVSSFSICPFIFRCLEMSGRACVLPLPWLYECVLMAVRRDRLCIVLGRVGCQLSWMALAKVFIFFLRPLCFSVTTWAACEVYGGHVTPYTDKFRPKTGVSPLRLFHNKCKDSSENWCRPPKFCSRCVRTEHLMTQTCK